MPDDTILCGCGCGERFTSVDDYGRPRAFLHGHATRLRARKIGPVEQDAAAAAIANGTFRWCRARLLNALAGAELQGVLREVLGELLEDDDDAYANIVAALTSTGWLPGRRRA